MRAGGRYSNAAYRIRAHVACALQQVICITDRGVFALGTRDNTRNAGLGLRQKLFLDGAEQVPEKGGDAVWYRQKVRICVLLLAVY